MSESYSVQVGDAMSLVPSSPGEISEKQVTLERGKAYELKLNHLSTNLDEGPDYDYTFQITLGENLEDVTVYDPEGLLGIHSDDQTFEEKKAYLLSFEVVGADSEKLDELRVAKMVALGVLGGNVNDPVLDPEADPDRFYIRLRGGAALTQEVSVTIATLGSDEKYNDDATEIELSIHESDLVSKSLLLVSDETDDKHRIDDIPDNDPNDRSHIIALGGRLRLTDLKIGTNELPMTRDLEVSMRKQVHITPIIVRDRPASEGGTVAYSVVDTSDMCSIVNERFAQVGVSVSWDNPVIVDPPSGANLYPFGLRYSEFKHGNPLSQEIQSLLDVNGTPNDTADIRLFVVKAIYSDEGGGVAGIALFPSALHASDQQYSGNFFIAPRSFERLTTGFDAAHELGHILLDEARAHRDFEPENLMYPFGQGEGFGIFGTKRLDEEQDEKINAN